MAQFFGSLVDSILAVGIVLLIPVTALNPTAPFVATTLAFVALATGRFLVERHNS
jgi:hypothetical protein